MRTNTKEILRRISEILDIPEPIIEIGALQVEGQASFGDLRPYFPGKQYLGVDMRPGLGVDQVENFEERSSFHDGRFKTVISLDTLEHVYDTFHFVREIDRILAPNGLLVLTSVMYFPIHAHPYDYWRFTPEAFRRLTAFMGEPLVLAQGPAEFPHTVVVVLRKGGQFTPAETEQLRRAVNEMPDTLIGCAWDSPREKALTEEIQVLRSYHAQWGRVSAAGFHTFSPEEWRRENADSLFDPNLSRLFFASRCAQSSRWLGMRTPLFPTDLMALQELCTAVLPKTILVIGSGQEGAAVFFASMLQLLHGERGRVFLVDGEISTEARDKVLAHPLGKSITIIEGAPADSATIAQTKSAAPAHGAPIMVFINEKPSYAGTRELIQHYHDLVSLGSYLIVANTLCRYLYDVPGGQQYWIDDNPLRAVQEFLMHSGEFAADRRHEKYMATFSPLGFLRRTGSIHLHGWKPNCATLEPQEDSLILRCTTYEGESGIWGGMLMGCKRTNQCDGQTLPCQPDTPYSLTLRVRGAANHDGVRLALNVIDDADTRLNETVVALSREWQAVSLLFRTGANVRHLGIQLVKARNPAPAVFEVANMAMQPESESSF